MLGPICWIFGLGRLIVGSRGERRESRGRAMFGVFSGTIGVMEHFERRWDGHGACKAYCIWV